MPTFDSGLGPQGATAFSLSCPEALMDRIGSFGPEVKSFISGITTENPNIIYDELIYE